MISSPTPALAVILVVLWATNWPASQMALDTMPPITFRIVTLLGGALFLFLLAVKARDSCAIPRGAWPKLIALSLLNVGIFNVLSAYSIFVLEGGRAAIMAFTMPVWVTIIETGLGNRITVGRAVSLLTGLMGLSLVLYSVVSDSSFDPNAALLMSIAALSWAVGSVWLANSPIRLGVRPTAMWMMVVSAVFVLVLIPVQKAPIVSLPTDASSWFGLIFATVVGMGVCQSLWFALLGLVGPVRGAFVLLAIPPVGVLMSWCLINATVSTLDVFGLVLLLVAALTSVTSEASANSGPTVSKSNACDI